MVSSYYRPPAPSPHALAAMERLTMLYCEAQRAREDGSDEEILARLEGEIEQCWELLGEEGRPPHGTNPTPPQ